MRNAWMVAVGVAWMLAGCSGDACVGEALADGGCSASQPDAGRIDSGPAVTVCAADRDCSDDRFCTGVERCDPTVASDPSGCIEGEPPCQMEGVTCVEAAARCMTDCGTSADADDDGYDSIDCGGDDCDDSLGSVYPGASEVCDAEGINEDCVPATLGPDRDGDGAPSEECCYLAAGAVEPVCGGDCDDDDPARSPDASEICNAIDDDCDGNVDEGLPSAAFYADADGDGYGTGEARVLCGPDATYTAPRGGDCADDDPTVSPGEAETCNGRDDDCDPATWGAGEDDDADGFADADCGGDDCYDASATAGPDVCDVVSLAAGMDHTCLLEGGGNVLCWGRNDDGQVGSGSTELEITAPTFVAGLPPAMGLTAGLRFTCAVTRTGSIYCWGSNTAAQLGTGAADMMAHRAPEASPWLSGVTRIEAGSRHVCAVADSALSCWGANEFGQVGTGATSAMVARPRRHPTIVSPLAIALGVQHSCVLTGTLHHLMCWGSNTHGELGTGGTVGVLSPQLITNAGVAYEYLGLTAGSAHTCAVDGTSTWCWGWNDVGQLGNASTVDASRPVRTRTLAGMVQLASSNRHSCAVRSDATVACWGWGVGGQLGDGGNTSRSTPVGVVGLTDAVQVATGLSHSCALRSTGQVLCWGHNGAGQLGSAGVTESWTPIPIAR